MGPSKALCHSLTTKTWDVWTPILLFAVVVTGSCNYGKSSIKSLFLAVFGSHVLLWEEDIASLSSVEFQLYDGEKNPWLCFSFPTWSPLPREPIMSRRKCSGQWQYCREQFNCDLAKLRLSFFFSIFLQYHFCESLKIFIKLHICTFQDSRYSQKNVK